MADLDKTYLKIIAAGNGADAFAAAPAMLLVTLIYLVAVLSVPVSAPQKLIWLAAYPIIASEITGVGFLRVFLRSLWIIPLVALIGLFNPIIETETAFTVAGVSVSRGWVSFISILLRGLLSFQAVIILVSNTGFINLFNSMRKVGFPSVLTTQLLLTYRYLTVIMEEAMVMKRARVARGYGRKSYPLKEWGVFIGQLLLISTNRATEIHRAMLSRGFSGTLPTGVSYRWNTQAWLWLICWTTAILLLRFLDLSSLFQNFVIHQ